ncbi:tetratricopeptide repeat protein [Dyadobacter arcticus]|uniref:Tetratricopeptide (TPR) repeat protein n=1 Tax=Dyadobacter arcticus TaxID=1078754 RepID=A0ABX0UPS8_9BACT|nr:tetratricopeptide repeat protein [Dyadobacter arcticus]NIJ53964.1 tetratricopeptide (TPR) repeat protein [Dyadobacter arcticus]
MKSNFFRPILLLSLIVFGWVNQSCQSDARNATRIPPVIKKSRVQWENDALLSLTDLINRGIDSDLNYFKRARIYFEREQYTEALDDINESIYEQDNVSEYFLLRGKINRELGKFDPALEDAQRAEALQQSSPELYVLMADILQAQGQFREAAGYLNQAMKMAPYDGGAYYVKGMLQARQGDSLASLSSLNYAMNVNPKLLRAYEQSIIILRKLKNTDQALIVNDKAIKRFPNEASLYFERGEIYNVLSKPDTALINYEKAAAINPSYNEAQFQIATIGIHLRQFYKALPALEKLLKKKPQSKEINNMIGFCYEKTEDFEKAKGYYTTALTLSPGDQDARYGLYRIRQHENEGIYQTYDREENTRPDYKLLDTSRVKISIIKPRGTTNIRIDSTRKAKIE